MTDEVRKKQWPNALDGYWNLLLSDSQAAYWMEEIRESVKGATNTETHDAIKWAKLEGQKIEKYHPCITDVIHWVRDYRRIQKDKTSMKDRANFQKAFVSEWKEKLSRGAKRDDFICALDAAANQWPFMKNHIVYNETARQVLG